MTEMTEMTEFLFYRVVSVILFELKNHLASYMLPSKIIYKKSLPLIPSDKNKINKEELKKELKTK